MISKIKREATERNFSIFRLKGMLAQLKTIVVPNDDAKFFRTHVVRNIERMIVEIKAVNKVEKRKHSK